MPALAVSAWRERCSASQQTARLTQEEDLVLHARGRIGLQSRNVAFEVVPSVRRRVDHPEGTFELRSESASATATAPIGAAHHWVGDRRSMHVLIRSRKTHHVLEVVALEVRSCLHEEAGERLRSQYHHTRW